jgi:DNA-binding NarL/FixJ family response regulator
MGAAPLQHRVESLAALARVRLEPAVVAPMDGRIGQDRATSGRLAKARERRAAPTPRAHPFSLTERETQVLPLLAAGYTNRQIARALFVSESTAGVHVSRIIGKMGVTNRVEAAALAVRSGLADQDREQFDPIRA